MAAERSSIDESELVRALRDGDERAFETLVARYHTAFVRLARDYARSEAVAEEVVQEAWIGVLEGIDGFEGRSSLRAWISRIVVHTARRRAAREGRSIPFSALDASHSEASVHADHFAPEDHPVWPGHWQSEPSPWPEERLLSKETATVAEAAISRLPPAQRQVLLLRDVEGMDAADVCAVLEISEGNQRVLLHRARTSVRRALDAHLAAKGETS